MAQNWHKNSALVRACSGFTRRVSDCEELVGIFRNPPLPYLDEWKNIDYGLQDKIVIKLNFWIPKKQYESPE